MVDHGRGIIRPWPRHHSTMAAASSDDGRSMVDHGGVNVEVDRVNVHQDGGEGDM